MHLESVLLICVSGLVAITLCFEPFLFFISQAANLVQSAQNSAATRIELITRQFSGKYCTQHLIFLILWTLKRTVHWLLIYLT